MRARIRIVAIGLAVVAVAACGTDEGSGDGSRPVDAPREDGPVDAPPIDAPHDASTVSVRCETADQACVPPAHCCQLGGAADECVPGNTGQCAGEEMACDGPEDCGPNADCCWFEGQGSRCIVAGNCGFTGAISAPMCHLTSDCLGFPSCCPVTPAGAPAPLYSTCSFSSCAP